MAETDSQTDAITVAGPGGASASAEAGRAAFVARWALAGVAVLVPLATSNLTGLGFANPFTNDLFSAPKLLVLVWSVAIASAAWIMGPGRSGRVWHVPRMWSLGAAFIGFALISAIASPHPPSAIFGSALNRQGFLTLAAYALLVWLCVQVVRKRSHVRALGVAVVVGGLCVAVYGLIQVAGLDPARWTDTSDWLFERGFSTLANPDVYGGYLTLPLCLAVALALAARTTKTRLLAGLAACVVGIALVVSLTRAAWLGALAGLVVLALFWWRSGSSSRRLLAVAFAVVVVVVAIAVGISLTNESSDALDRVAELTARSSSLESRLVIWRAAAATAAERPLLGEGPDSLRFGWYRHESSGSENAATRYLVADDAHNAPLMLAATLGIPAAVCLVALWLGTVVAVGRLLWRSRDRIDMTYAGWCAAAVALGVYSLLGIGFVGIGPSAALVLGVLLAPLSREYRPGTTLRFATVALVGTIALAGIAYGTLTYASEAQVAASYVSVADQRAHAESAVRTAPWNYTARERLAAAIDMEALAQTDPARFQTLEQEAKDAYGDLIAFEPAEYFSYVEYATFLWATSRVVGESAKAEAEDVLDQAREVRPNAMDLTGGTSR